MFTSEITEREKQLGFAVDKVVNQNAEYMGHREYVYGVVYRFDDNNIIVKERCPLGGFRYCFRRKQGAGFLTVSNVDTDPLQAIDRVRKYLSDIKGTEVL